MDFALFNDGGMEMFLRWIHYFAGVIWIGFLYFFNFVQMDWFGQLAADEKLKPAQGISVRTLVPRVLFWFRWGAMFTFFSGLLIYTMKSHALKEGLLSTSWWPIISVGAALGTVMFLNVWLIIWPNQKIVIASANQVAGGGAALPEAAEAGVKARRASRHNTMFSLPMLFFMGAASHLPLNINPEYNGWALFAALAVIIGALEFNAIKGNVKPIDSTNKVIGAGAILTAILYLVIELMA